MNEWQGNGWRVIQGDCLDVLKGMDAGSVDLCLTDPPYGIKINRRANQFGAAAHKSRQATDLAWDDAAPTPEYFTEMMRVSQQQIVFGANYFWESFYSSQCYIVWDKRADLPDVPFCPTEFAWTSFVDKPSKRYVIRNHGFIRDSKDERTGHPTQKPTELMASILQDFTKPDALILDPFMGSGTTGVACLRTGRKFVGIEISEQYCEIAVKRLRAEEARLALPQQIEMANDGRTGASGV